ncbi:MAG: hypothetical protein M3389_12240 [Actinomycetota bacterium]|nr:hypothetical protein [Actinomycetota bacterium]
MNADAKDALDAARALANMADQELLVLRLPAGADSCRVAVRARRRGDRYDLDDNGAAIAGHDDWYPTAASVAAQTGTNVNRRGALFLPGVPRTDVAARARQIADASARLMDELATSGRERRRKRTRSRTGKVRDQ